MKLPTHPLAHLPRWAALALLALTLLGSAWNVLALDTRDQAQRSDIAERTARGERPDMDLYRAINARVAAGVSYHAAAAAEHREFAMPTSPFVTVRTPVLAWTSAWWGADGWRTIAALLWGANMLAWFNALRADGMGRALAGGALAGVFGMVAFIPDIAFSHDILAGLMLSLALALSAGRAWPLALLLAVLAILLRELALPFLLAWGAIALAARERHKALAIGAALVVVALALAGHAWAVAAVRLPGDFVSPGWSGFMGPALPLYGIHVTTLLHLLPTLIAGPLAVLALLGWLGAGKPRGLFAALWFTGFFTAVALFARQENFYWMGLFVPAFGIGLVFVPQALRDLLCALRRPSRVDPNCASR